MKRIWKRAGFVFGMLVWSAAAPGYLEATTGLDLSDRIVLDGFTGDYDADESLFQLSPAGTPEESTIDSRWGRFNDLNNLRLTWDANFLYIAVDGFIFENNTMVFFDTVPLPDGQNPGFTSLSQSNSWRRQASFDNGIFPDFFVATWDGNTTPQAWQFSGPNTAVQVPEGSFTTVASFSRDLPGRAMEAAIPWDALFLGQGTRAFDAAYGDTVYTLPPGAGELKIVSWITTGADGLGGPDSAPDNLSGHQVDSAVEVVLDNYIRVQLDRFDVNGDPNPDGVPDFGVPVRVPTTPGMTDEEYRAVTEAFFFVPPPVRGQTVEFELLEATPKAIAPGLGDEVAYRFSLTPKIEDPKLRAARQIRFSASVYDMNANRVRTLYRDETFTLEELESEAFPDRNRFDGRDDDGRLLDAGVYILRVVLEPGLDEIKKPVVVVR